MSFNLLDCTALISTWQRLDRAFDAFEDFVEKTVRLDVKGLEHFQNLYQVEAPYSAFILGYEGLRFGQFVGQFALQQPNPLSLVKEQLRQLLVSRVV